jgi:hypothetical protein
MFTTQSLAIVLVLAAAGGLEWSWRTSAATRQGHYRSHPAGSSVMGVPDVCDERSQELVDDRQ